MQRKAWAAPRFPVPPAGGGPRRFRHVARGLHVLRKVKKSQSRRRRGRDGSARKAETGLRPAGVPPPERSAGGGGRPDVLLRTPARNVPPREPSTSEIFRRRAGPPFLGWASVRPGARSRRCCSYPELLTRGIFGRRAGPPFLAPTPRRAPRPYPRPPDPRDNHSSRGSSRHP